MLRLALCFHLSRHLDEQAALASHACYRGLLEVCLRHPGLKINLSLSGTLIAALAWLDPEPIERIREGLKRGQFALMGSTYADNLLLACDDWDNAQQLALHRDALQKAFGVRPRAFWNPGRTWGATHATLLSAAGYESTLVSSRTLRAAGAALPACYAYEAGDTSLRLLWDDELLRAWFDQAVWFHRVDDLATHLDSLASASQPETLFPVCAQEAEAYGLWAYERGLDPRADWHGLDAVLGFLERRTDVELCHLDLAPPPRAWLSGLPVGWSESLDHALALPGARLHEPGYADWHDFLLRSPKVAHFHHLHNAIRNRLTALGSAWADAGWVAPAPEMLPRACATFYRMAIRAACEHQYQFGRAGIGGRGDPGWEGVAPAFALARAAEFAEAIPRPSTLAPASIEDVTGDGEDEILLRQGRWLAMLTHLGGRLLYWFDLVEGRELVGNPWAVPLGEHRMDVALPDLAPLVSSWSPSTAAPLGEPVWEPVPTRRGADLPGWIWEGSRGALPVWPRQPEDTARPGLAARRRALNDFIAIEDQAEVPADAALDYRLEDTGATFLRFFDFRMGMTKHVRLTPQGLRVTYHFHNGHDQTQRLRLRLVSELTPDGQDLLGCGPETLVPVLAGGGQPGVLNARTGNAIISRASRKPVEPASFSPGLLSVEVCQSFEIPVAPNQSEALTVRLQALSPHEQGLLGRGLRRLKTWALPPPS